MNPLEARTVALEELMRIVRKGKPKHALKAAELILNHSAGEPSKMPSHDIEIIWDDEDFE